MSKTHSSLKQSISKFETNDQPQKINTNPCKGSVIAVQISNLHENSYAEDRNIVVSDTGKYPDAV
jgi:hypothetical protein